MSIRHFYSQTVADGTATSVVRPSDWNSAHNMVLNIAGNTAGTSQISGTDIVWAGGNNVTLSANGSTVSIHGPTVPAQTVQTQASGNIAGAGFTSASTVGSDIVATHNSNGLSVGIPAYLTTAQPVGVYLTTAAQSDHSHNFATTTTGGSNIVVGTANSAGATFGVPAYLTTYAAQTTQTQPAGNIAGVGTTFAGTNVSATIGLDSNGLNLALSAAAGGGGGGADGVNVIQIGTTGTSGTAFSASTGTVFFNGSNNITVSQNNSNQIVISGPTLTQYLTTAQPVGAYLTTARASNDAIGLNTALTANGVSVTANSSGLSINVPAFLTTAAQSNHSHNFATTTTVGSNIVVGTANSAGATIGVPAFITTATQSVQTQAAGNIAGVGTTFAGTGILGSMTFNSNGLNLALAEAVATDTWFATGANTIAGTNTSGTFSNDGYVVSGAGILSAGISGNTLILSVPSGGGAGDGVNIVQAGTVGTSGTTFSSISGTVRINGGANITVSQNGSNDIVIVGAAGGGGGGVTMGKWEPFYPAGTTTSTPGLNSLYLQKLRPSDNVSFSYIERRMSNNFSSSSVAQSAGYTFGYGLYSRGAGTNSTRMELMGSSQIIMNAAMSSSSVSFTVSQGAASFTSGSASSNLMSLVTGFKHLYMPYTGTLSAGQEYWFGMVMSSSGTSNPLRVGMWEQSVINNLTVGKIYGSTVSASNASFVGDFNQGVYGTTTGAFPTSIADSQLTNAVSQNRMYLQFDDGV